jgi:hypothetical protein
LLLGQRSCNLDKLERGRVGYLLSLGLPAVGKPFDFVACFVYGGVPVRIALSALPSVLCADSLGVAQGY